MVPAWYRVIKMLSDTLSNLIELNHGEFSKYHLWPSKLISHMLMYYFSNIDPKWLKGDHCALGHPQQPRQAQLWRVQQVSVIKNLHDTCLYAIFQRQIDWKRSQQDTGYSVLPLDELIEVAEGVPQIILGPIQQIVFFSNIVHETCFKCSLLWI